MLTKEIFVDIHVRFAQGQSLRKIASELGISRNTVKHHLQQQTMPTMLKEVNNRLNYPLKTLFLVSGIELAKPD
ncbi:LuxR C-terminal-related transcriptional regulator (plasmid) [Arsenophonus nasoniae]|uniref:helix-turn-helix domain-containing protein n=1 Tax=Arsenophonus nasoniae TaxID=638 RepID=UPI002469607B|nr:helix-turn-helix domain-containing protein [Arsenophonus nasoniae]WGM18167.1 LuxR C-terminal-related transcriptional regulator [Arsenophonus nasoniae]